MFTCNCLIRKDTKHIRDTLRRYGYKGFTLSKDKYDALMVTKRSIVGMPISATMEDGTEWHIDKYLKWNPQVYDCGDNEDLFLALASMNDHKFDNSWYVDGDGNIFFIESSTYEQREQYCCGKIKPASKEQLVERFKQQ